jgi:hypothetical protein
MGNWYKVSGQYDDGCKVYKKDYIVFAESSSDAEQKIFHLKLPYDCSFFPCTVTKLIKNIIYEF